MKKIIKRIISSSLLFLGVAIGTGCSMSDSAGVRTGDTTGSVEQALIEGTTEAEQAESNTQTELLSTKEDELTGEPEDGIDVDLTVMSPTMVYAEVFNMMNSPEQYMGKTVKMQGAFAVYEDESNGEKYYSCIVKDATACCSTGIEFVRADAADYPDDYPAVGNEIVVKGIFDTYEEEGNKYCTLRSADMQTV